MQLPCTRRGLRGLIATAALLWATVAPASETATRNFNVPADKAPAALKVFSQQAGVEVLFPTDAVAGIRTNATRGDLTPRAALEKMVAGTGFVVVQDEKTGALGLRAEAKAAKNADSRSDSTPAAQVENGMLKLEKYTVLGSRIRQTEVEGPSPVNTYNADYIRATGSFTLADFLNQLPQTYAGIASGRGSTPNELNPEFGQRTETTTPAFNLVTGASAAPPAQTGVSGVSLRGLGAGSTLVLVDGRRAAQSGNGNRGMDTRQGFVDLNTIPLGMIDRIEVSTDGASAIYGADAVAGVINIILKKNYSGTEISGAYRAAEHGGGRERSLTVLQGFNFGRLTGSVAIDYFDRQSLKASERSFSANQNHTAIPRGILVADGSTLYGRDYRLNWGYPAVIQASGGTVSGTFNALPGVRVVLVPEGSSATPLLSQFVPVSTVVPPATVVNASGQRRMNTAEFLDLIPESERTGLSSNFTYKLIADRLDAYASFRTSKSTSFTNAQLGGNSITGGFGTAALLPAALNPFNQNVTIGMVLPEWGSESQRVRTLADAGTLGVYGKLGETWEFDLGGGLEQQKVRQVTRNFRSAGFSALLTAVDPSRRFNPFVDYRVQGAPSQAALLETLSNYPYLGSVSELASLDFSANGDLFDLPGGTVKMAFGGSASRSEVQSVAVNYSNALVPVATSSTTSYAQSSHAYFAEFFVPVVGKSNQRSLFRRLDFQLAGRHEEVGPFNKTVPKVGVSWAPLQSVLVRGSWSQGFRAPSVTEYLTPISTVTSTLSDPRRTPTTTSGIIETRGSNLNPKAEASENNFFGVVYEPAALKGLALQANFYETRQADTLQLLRAQDIINNESLFPGRVTRAAQTATDVSLNQPGQITGVDRVFVNFGRLVNRSADVVVDYTLPWQQFGTWRVNLAATRTLEATRQLAPGQPAVVLEEDTSSPSKWKLNTAVFWRHGSWNAAAFLWAMDGFTSNNAGNALVANSASVTFYPTPKVAKLDLRFGYEFKEGVWRGHGKGLRVGVGVNNVFDKEPPFSDTVWGFNAAIHSQLTLGRAYEFSFVLPM